MPDENAEELHVPTIFTRIIEGELPGHFVWRDDVCVSFLSINPITAGHSLVVPLAEVDHWVDLDTATNEHLMRVSHLISGAIQTVFNPNRVGLMIAGFEVPHTHVHVLGIDDMGDLSFANAAATVDHAELARYATSLRDALAAGGNPAPGL